MSEYVEKPKELDKYRLFLKGSALIPQRFWTWKLFHKKREFNEKELAEQGYVEQDIISISKRHKGISLTLLSN